MLEEFRIFDMMLGQYCGPALAGIKPANMICIKKGKVTHFNDLLKQYNYNMNKRDIYFTVINETESGYLLLVYRRKKLSQHMAREEVCKALLKIGYPVEGIKGDNIPIEKYMERLKLRFDEAGGLPMEVGYFLGYPEEDVQGFNKYKGKNYLIKKYWKVYANVEKAEELFSRYDKCKDALCIRLSNGMSIMDIFSGSTKNDERSKLIAQ